MAEQALLDAVQRIERLAEEVLSTFGVGGVPGRPDPAGIPARIVVGETQDVRTSRIIPADERHVAVGRAERVVDDRMQHPVLDRGLDADPAIRQPEGVVDRGIIGVGDRARRIRERRQRLAAKQGGRVTAGAAGARDLGMAMGAPGFAHERSGLRLQRMLGAVRARGLERGGRLADGTLLQGGPAQQPGGLRIGPGGEDRPQDVPGLAGPAGLQQRAGQQVAVSR